MNKQSEKLKILHISRSMGQGGAQKVVYQLCKDNGNAKQYVASTGGEYVEELVGLGIAHHIIPDIDRKNPFLILKTYFIISKIVRKEKIDLIHTHHRMAAFYARLIQLSNYSVGHLYTAHNVFYGRKRFMRFALKCARIIAVGDGVRKNLIEEYKIEPDKITIIRNTIKNERTHMVNNRLQELKKDGNVLIGNIGRLVAIKGIDIFIQAFAEVIKRIPNAIAVVIGDGEQREELGMMTQKLGLNEHIVFLGFQKNVLDIINQLDLVVLSSRREGLPLTPIEVISQGKTVIASNISGNNEVIKDGFNGLLFEKDNVSELAEKIVLLIENKGYRRQLEQNAKNTYSRSYDYDTFIRRYMEQYHALKEECNVGKLNNY